MMATFLLCTAMHDLVGGNRGAYGAPVTLLCKWIALRRSLAVAFVCSVAAHASLAAPVLYSEPAHSSPVTAGPDDLLLLAGSGLSPSDLIVYRLVDGSAATLRPPSGPPSSSDGTLGMAQIVSADNAPWSLAVKFPPSLKSGRVYTVWARSADGEWSNAVRVNDPRPLWFSPARVRSSQTIAGLPRYLKVIGRNLRPLSGVRARLRLSGPQLVEVSATPSGSGVEDYAMTFVLPSRLAVGPYRVSFSGDGLNWAVIDAQELQVGEDAPPAAVAEAGDARFGGCRPDDENDDTPCLQRAIEALRSQGGTVHLGRGRWLLSTASLKRIGGADGLTLPSGVSLRGEGVKRTLLERRTPVGAIASGAAFTLLGGNAIQGIHFRDQAAYGPVDPPAPTLQLGGKVIAISGLIISNNRFEGSHPAVSSDGGAVRDLFITHNEFGAYDFALILRGNRFETKTHFQIQDAVISHNVFKPGSYLDLPIRQGAIASQLGAAFRVDFSDNVADGASTQYLYRSQDAAGWRAAFFWSLSGGAEQLLISKNDITCSGDKDGDGEAIALDNDGNTFAYGVARDVIAATSDSITIDGLPRTAQSGREVPADFYTGHWVQIVAGPGIGQTRKIQSYRLDPVAKRMLASVSPRWDVPPGPRSRALVARQFWQVSIVGNRVDNRQPLCRKSNRNGPKAGVIGLWAQVSDSTVAGNLQYDSDGILINQNYNAEDPTCSTCDAGAFVQFFVDIRDNRIDGEYDWNSDCSHSGIYLANSAAPTPGSAPPTVSFGVSVARNQIQHADGLRGGAIVVPLTWHQGPAPHDWPLVRDLLIHHNDISDLSGPPPRHSCDDLQIRRLGINLYRAQMVHGTVLYANACRGVTTPLHDGGTSTRRVCPSSSADSCECAGVLPK